MSQNYSDGLTLKGWICDVQTGTHLKKKKTVQNRIIVCICEEKKSPKLVQEKKK